MTVWQRFLNDLNKFIGLLFSTDLFQKCRKKELIDALSSKICTDLTYHNISKDVAETYTQNYLTRQARAVDVLFQKTVPSVIDKNTPESLNKIFIKNPLFTLILIKTLEKRGLIKCHCLNDLIFTLISSMDWSTHTGPYIDAIKDVQTILRSYSAKDNFAELIDILKGDSLRATPNIDLVEEMKTQKDPGFKISDVTYLSWEFKGFYQVGGLAEAAYSIAKSFKDKRHTIPARVVLPYFPNLLRAELKTRIGPTEKFAIDSHTTIDIRRFASDNLEYIFIEDPSFANIRKLYGAPSEQGANVETMLKFSKLASGYLLKTCTPSSIIHLNDWHVARVATLVKEASIELPQHDKPTCVFTFHNNNIPCQGLFKANSANPYQSAYAPSDIEFGLHLQKQAMACSDILSTVSPTYAKECLSPSLGHGLESLLETARKAGRFYGILNGIHAASWNPFNNSALETWKAIDSGAPLDLRFNPTRPHIETKKLALRELNAWVKKYWPEKTKNFDEDKPLFVYTGRYDYHQKGLEHLPAIIDEVLKQGGNVLFLGSSADSTAEGLLTHLTQKYSSNPRLVIINDVQANGKFNYQDTQGERPGIRELTRMAASAMFMTSNFEPCGLVQMESFKFGSIVIARKTGGLADTVIPFNKGLPNPNGYFLDEESIKSMITDAIKQAQDPDAVNTIVQSSNRYNWDFSPDDAPSKIDAFERLYRLGHMHKFAPVTEKTRFRINQPWILSSDYHEIDPAHTKIHHMLGAHNVPGGTKFSLHAPNAKSVIIEIQDANGLTTRTSQVLYKSTSSGLWVLNYPKNEPLHYRYLIDGKYKIDPFAKSFKPVAGQTVPFCVHYPDSEMQFDWTDASFIIDRKAKHKSLSNDNVFEVHLKRFAEEQHTITYDAMARRLVEMSKTHGFKKIELMGIFEHPNEASLGYQITGFFAPNHRYGTPKDFKRFVNTLHEAGIEVVVDFVFNHFAQDSWALEKFDGTNLFEKRNFWDFRQWYGWGRYFDFRNPFTQKFLFASVRNMIETYHIDGFRIDAVRPAHRELFPYATRLLQTFNAFIHKHFPGVKTYAEDYRTRSNALGRLNQNGLGFDSKWNLGMVHHMLNYLVGNGASHLDLMIRDCTRDQIFPLSHDHVNQKVGFLQTRVKASTQALKAHKINHTFFLLSLLPGEKLVHHDKAALKAFESLTALKEANPVAKLAMDNFLKILSKHPSLALKHQVNAGAEPSSVARELNDHGCLEISVKGMIDGVIKKYVLVLNTKETQVRLKDTLVAKPYLVSSYQLEHNEGEDQAEIAGHLRPLEARLFEV